MKTKQIKKIISIILCMTLFLSVMPITALAEAGAFPIAPTLPKTSPLPIMEENGLVTDFTDFDNEKSSYIVSNDFVVDNGVLLTYFGTNPHVVIPANLGITEIGRGALGTCGSIVESVVIPEGVTHINFIGGSSKLTSITLPSTLKTITWEAFSGTGITSITIPKGVESIGVMYEEVYGFTMYDIIFGLPICQIIFEAEVPPVIELICWNCRKTDCPGWFMGGCSGYRCWECYEKDCIGYQVGGCGYYECWHCVSAECDGGKDCPDWYCWYCEGTTYHNERDCSEYWCWTCDSYGCDYDSEMECYMNICWSCFDSDCPGPLLHCPEWFCGQCNRGVDCKPIIYVPVGSKASYEAIGAFGYYKIVEGNAPPAPEPRKWIRLGIVTGGDRIRINDALEMLKHLAGIVVLKGDSFQAALVTQESRNLNRIRINDVLEVLKHLAGISYIN
jgi:hypothetical protein